MAKDMRTSTEGSTRRLVDITEKERVTILTMRGETKSEEDLRIRIEVLLKRREDMREREPPNQDKLRREKLK